MDSIPNSSYITKYVIGSKASGNWKGPWHCA